MAQDFDIAGRMGRTAPRVVRALARFWRSVARDLFDSYHPEQHYMRGPGPKWRAKHIYAGNEQA